MHWRPSIPARFVCAILVACHPAAGQDPAGFAGLPLQDWLEAGEVEEVDWDIDIDGPELRMDQRIEVAVSGRIRAGNLENAGSERDLVLWIGVTEAGHDDWIARSGAIRHSLEPDLPENADIEFDIRIFVTPGDYTFWVLMADESTRQHNLEIADVRVDEVNDDLFGGAYTGVPRIEFPDPDWLAEDLEVEGGGNLVLPVKNQRPLELELIAALSTPEQWDSFGPGKRHEDNIQDALIALSQLDLAHGTVSVTGLDLVRRRQVFRQTGIEALDIEGLEAAFEIANSPAISVADLTARTENPGFLREFVEDRIAGRIPDAGAPLLVLLFVTGITRFDDDAEVEAMRLGGGCDCAAYHIRMRQDMSDLFDEVEDIIDPLNPETYDVLRPDELRRAIRRIVEDLERF